MLREQAQDQRVEEQQLAAKQHASLQNSPTSLPSLELNECPDLDIGTLGTPIISQDKDEDISPPAVNTQQQRQICTLTQDQNYMLHMMEIPGYEAPFTPPQSASRSFQLQFLCDFANAVLDEDTGNLLEYRHLIKHPKYKETWSNSFGQEIRRLTTTKKTIFFINETNIPQDRRGDITYGRIVCAYREEKKDKYRTQITIGGNFIQYPGNCGTPTADLLTVKLLLISIISTPNTKFMSIDIKDFYLCTPMTQYEYFQMKLELFPEDIIKEYDLHNKVDATSNVHCKVRRGMYGLPQAGIIMQELLEKRLLKAGYHQSKDTPGNPSVSHWLWTTLVSSISTKLTSTISSKHSSKTTRLKKTGRELGILASHWTGTTRNAKYTSPCKDTLNKH